MNFIEVEYCPDCRAKLSTEPDGNKVYRCSEHGEMIISALQVDE